MPDREKVINGLMFCSDIEHYAQNCGKCPYKSKLTDFMCFQLLRDALALLKEQETKWIHRADMDYKDKNGVVHFHGMCESCGFIHDFIDGHTGQYKFCPECGRSVK